MVVRGASILAVTVGTKAARGKGHDRSNPQHQGDTQWFLLPDSRRATSWNRFPHLGIGTAMSPSLSPSISLRASAFAEERGKRDCVSQSGQQGCEPAQGNTHLHSG